MQLEHMGVRDVIIKSIVKMSHAQTHSILFNRICCMFELLRVEVVEQTARPEEQACTVPVALLIESWLLKRASRSLKRQ